LRRGLAGVVHVGVLALRAFVVERARSRERVGVLLVVLFVVGAVGLAVVPVAVVYVGLAVASGPAKTLEKHAGVAEGKKVRERAASGRALWW